MGIRTSIRFREVSATFTRPNDANIYAAGDLIANSTTAASVVPLEWVNPFAAPFTIESLRIRKAVAGTSATNATFRVHLFSVVPTIATAGDNSAIASNVTDVSGWIASFQNTVSLGFAGSTSCLLVPTEGLSAKKAELIAPGASVYGLVEALAAYTPTALEVWTIYLTMRPRG